ncbi:MAG: DUF2892 domain-containing protein [Candidatus Falkowbacteria bacterium]|nr:DUF2892 domain-containing protein [Candidatus Falkowbacteria bacterium]
MKKNIGKLDRLGRLFLGIVCLIIALLASFSVVVRIIVALVGLFTIYEALAGWCAFYALIGKNTCPIKYE